MAPFTQSASTGIVGFETNEAGYITRGRINSVPTTGLDTTTLTYAAGCEIVDSSTANSWVNIGTAVAPVWSFGVPGFQQVVVSAASIPLLFGGTNVLLIPAPAGSGTNSATIINDMVLEYVGAGGTGFTGGGSTVRLVYGSAGTNIAAFMNLGTATFFGTATKVLQAQTPVNSTSGISVIPGMGIYMDNTTAAYAGGGTSSLKVSLWYSIIPV